MSKLAVHKWIKTPCGRSKFDELSQMNGIFAVIRLSWFVFFAALKDWNLPNPDQDEASDS